MPTATSPKRLTTIRRGLLVFALALTALLFGVDRYAAHAHRPTAESARVVLYTTVWCPYCATLRADLSASAVAYVDHDVEHSLQGMLGWWTLRARGVPVAVIGPSVVHGYDVEKIALALKHLGHTYRPARDPGSARGAPSLSQQ
jgi:glutaredoxin